MKPKHIEGERVNARATLAMIGVRVGQEFHTLRSEQVEELLKEADRVRYRKPPNANGSRGRYFFQLLQRRAGA